MKYIAHCIHNDIVSLVSGPTLVRYSDTCRLIHYSANQLGHGRRSAEKKRDENKAFNRILFYRPYTLNPRWQIFHGNKGDTVVLLFLYQCHDKIGPIFQNFYSDHNFLWYPFSVKNAAEMSILLLIFLSNLKDLKK